MAVLKQVRQDGHDAWFVEFAQVSTVQLWNFLQNIHCDFDISMINHFTLNSNVGNQFDTG